MIQLTAFDFLRNALGHDAAFIASLVTRGRRTGNSHTVRLKAVSHLGLVYFSRHRPDSDWYLNAAANSDVNIIFEMGSVIHGLRGKRATDDDADDDDDDDTNDATRVAGCADTLMVPGTACVVHDEALLGAISCIKYPGEARAGERRVAIGVALDFP